MPIARLVLSGVGCATVAAPLCGLLYAILTDPRSPAGGLAFLVGVVAGAIAGLLVGISVSLRVYRARVEARLGEGAAPIADTLGPALVGVAAFVVVVPILLFFLI